MGLTMISRDQARKLQKDLQAAMAGISLPGWTFRVHTIRYGETARITVEASPMQSDGTVVSQEAEDFRKLAPAYGLAATDLHRKFSYRGEVLEIVGLRIKARKRPIICVDGNQRQTVWPAHLVQSLLKTSAPPAKADCATVREQHVYSEETLKAKIQEVDSMLHHEQLTDGGRITSPYLINKRRKALQEMRKKLVAQLEGSTNGQ